MTTLALVLVGVVGSVIGVVVVQLAVADQARVVREVRADLAEIEAAQDASAQQVTVVTDLPSGSSRLLAGEVLTDSQAGDDWEPISPDLIA